MHPSFAEYRLPRGRHGLPPELVKANQRWRLLGACAEVLAQRGYARTGVAEVTTAAAVSKATFYRNFDGLPSCILATFELATQGVLAVVDEACGSDSETEPSLAEVLSHLLDFLEEEPALARALTDSALDDVPGVCAARTDFVDRCSSRLAAAGGGGSGKANRRRARHLLLGVQGWLSMRLAAGEAVTHPRELAHLLAL